MTQIFEGITNFKFGGGGGGFEGHAVALVTEALRYKSVGRGFDSRLFRSYFSLT